MQEGNIKKCDFCGLKDGQTVRINGGGLVKIRIGKTKNGIDNICGYCKLKLLQGKIKC